MSGVKSKTRKAFVDPLDPLERGLEAVRSLGHNARKGLQSETEESAKTFLEQLGLSQKTDAAPSEQIAQTQSHESAPQSNGHVEIFNSANHPRPAHSEKTKGHTEKASHSKAEAALDYHGQYRTEITKSRERATKGEMNEMRQNIEQIKAELSKLVSSSEMLKFEFAEVSVEQTPTTVGQYHLNFFEWMLAVIRSAREKVEDSGAWLNTVKGKGQKGYWGMFKKHGTTFGLSGERAVATSVG